MTKFGELISAEEPVLIDFYFDWEDADNSIDTLRDVAAALGDKAKVIKIDIKKNEPLAEALRVKGNPIFLIYRFKYISFFSKITKNFWKCIIDFIFCFMAIMHYNNTPT
jgi:thioredoxin 1